MKEDILEQIVEDHLVALGFFTTHNIRFQPDKADAGYVARDHSVSSDIDVVGIRPVAEGPNEVVVISCKSWQEGFDARAKLNALRENKVVNGREAWKMFRELWHPLWAAAFRRALRERTRSETFRYRIAVTSICGPIAKGVDDATACREATKLWASDPGSRRTLQETRSSSSPSSKCSTTLQVGGGLHLPRANLGAFFSSSMRPKPSTSMPRRHGLPTWPSHRRLTKARLFARRA